MTARRSLAIPAAVVAIALSIASAARAQTIGIAAVEESALARRLSAELRTRGYDVRPLDAARDLAAILTVEDEPPSIRVCVVGADCETLSDRDASVLLIRAVEVVRARVGEPRPSEPPVVETAPVRAEPAVHRFDIALTLGLLPPTGGFSTGLAASLAFDWSPAPALSFELGGLLGFVDPNVDDASGSATAGARLVWLGADLVLPESVLAGNRLLFGLAAALAVTELDADARPPLEAFEDTAVSLLLLARTAFVVRIVERVGLMLGVRAGLALPRPVVVFDRREVAAWGAPFVTVDLGVVFRL
jgi:hypothetical protein